MWVLSLEEINHRERSFPSPHLRCQLPSELCSQCLPRKARPGVLPSEAATGERVAGRHGAECRRPGEQRSSQEREKQVHRPREGAILRMQDWGDKEKHSLGKGPGCTPHLSPRSQQASKHPDSTDPFNICHQRKEGPKCPELSTLCPDGSVQSLMVSPIPGIMWPGTPRRERIRIEPQGPLKREDHHSRLDTPCSD